MRLRALALTTVALTASLFIAVPAHAGSPAGKSLVANNGGESSAMLVGVESGAPKGSPPTNNVAVGEIIICQVGAVGSGSSNNLATGVVGCSASVDAIVINMWWYSYRTGALLKTQPGKVCFYTRSCSLQGTLFSNDPVSVQVCSTTSKTGYVFPYACVWVIGF